MTSKKLLILSLAAILVVAAGLWIAGRQASPGGSVQDLLYPQLKEQLGTASAVRLFAAGDTLAVELTRQDESGTASPEAAGIRQDGAPAPGVRKDMHWGVAQRAGYPVDGTRLRKLLLSIADAKIAEEKTSDPERYASLGVQDLAAGAGGVRLEIDPGPVNLIVGKRGAGAQSNYVRRAGEPQSWLIDAAIDVPTTPEDWLYKDLLDVSADRIQSAAVTLQGAQTYTASKATRADADFKVEGLPRGKKLSSSSAANSAATALVGLSLDDVQPAATFAAGAADARAEFRTFDGLIVSLDGWQRDNRHFIAAEVSFDPEQAARFMPVSTSDADSPEARQAETPDDAQGDDRDPARSDAANNTPEAGAGTAAVTDRGTPAGDPAGNGEVARQAQALQARLAGWVYEIPDYKYEGIFRPAEELLAN